jgi:RNAse (barnase) inhibitor barstar
MNALSHIDSGVYVVASEECADAVVNQGAAAGLYVARLAGRDIVTKQAFLDAAASAFQFPDYFGHNWDAFEDCLQDLVWTAPNGCILVLDHFDRFALSEPHEWAIGLEILQRTIDAAPPNGKPRLVLLRGPRSAAPGIPAWESGSRDT